MSTRGTLARHVFDLVLYATLQKTRLNWLCGKTLLLPFVLLCMAEAGLWSGFWTSYVSTGNCSPRKAAIFQRARFARRLALDAVACRRHARRQEKSLRSGRRPLAGGWQWVQDCDQRVQVDKSTGCVSCLGALPQKGHPYIYISIESHLNMYLFHLLVLRVKWIKLGVQVCVVQLLLWVQKVPLGCGKRI